MANLHSHIYDPPVVHPEIAIIIKIIIIMIIIIIKTCMLIDVAISGDRNVIKKEAEKILRPYNGNTKHVECKNKGDSSNNRHDWDHFKVI
jgi:hypothetical protein